MNLPAKKVLHMTDGACITFKEYGGAPYSACPSVEEILIARAKKTEADLKHAVAIHLGMPEDSIDWQVASSHMKKVTYDFVDMYYFDDTKLLTVMSQQTGGLTVPTE